MKKNTAGFSLIEVLISLFIFSFILLSFNAAALLALRENQRAYLLSLAASQLYSMGERLRTLESHQGLAQQIAIWNQQNQKLLPFAQGYVEGSYPIYKITLTWGEKNPHQQCDKKTVKINCLSETIKI